MRPGARRRLWFALLLLLPFVFRDDLSRYALARVGAFAVAATGIAIVSGLAGQISLGHAGLMAAGAFTSAGLAVSAHWPFAAAWIVATVFTALVGLAFGIPSLRVRGQYLALATLGGGFIIWQIVRELASLTGGDAGLAGVPPPSFLGHEQGPLGSALVATALTAVALFVAGNLSGSRLGRSFRAVRDSETGAAASGISIYRAKLVAFVASAVLAGAAGALLAHTEGFIAPNTFDPGQSFLLVLAAVLGGLTSPYGGAIGALLVLGPSDLFPAAFSWLERYQIVAWGPVALLVVFRWPEGVAGGISRLVQRRRAISPATIESTEARAIPSVAVPPITLAPADATVLVARGVTRSFGGLRALHNVDLDVRSGTIHALIGPNGSGKTTLLDCITGVRRADAGSVRFAGRRIDTMPSHRIAMLGLARTFQQVALFGTMTATENVLTGAHARSHGGIGEAMTGLSGDDRTLETQELLAIVGLSGYEDTPASALSYGQRKRLELARALALRPSLLLLDEPAAGRNEPEILELGHLLKRLRAAGLTILLVEHHMNFVLSLADVVTVLDEGRVVAHGEPADVRSDPAVVEAYLGATVA